MPNIQFISVFPIGKTVRVLGAVVSVNKLHGTLRTDRSGNSVLIDTTIFISSKEHSTCIKIDVNCFNRVFANDFYNVLGDWRSLKMIKLCYLHFLSP